MKRGKVFLHEEWVGILEETEDGFRFEYLDLHLKKENPEAISLTLPIRNEAYTSKVLFPFFDGLIPEGWLLDIATKNWKIDIRDRMSVLMVTCQDCIGAVSVQPIEIEADDT